MEKGEKRNCHNMRKKFQGVKNILEFNWHFYVGVICIGLVLFTLSNYIKSPIKSISQVLLFVLSVSTILSLIVSYCIYDYSDLYQFKFIKSSNKTLKVLNIHAGFDETSEVIKNKLPNSELVVLDFYNPEKHTEISIERARKKYPPFPNTLKTDTIKIKYPNEYFDKICVIFSAHEIRNQKERIAFFKELNRILSPKGEIYIAEHIRDIPNLLIYSIGAFHFYSLNSWMKIFNSSELIICQKSKSTIFVSNFILIKNGITA